MREKGSTFRVIGARYGITASAASAAISGRSASGSPTRTGGADERADQDRPPAPDRRGVAARQGRGPLRGRLQRLRDPRGVRRAERTNRAHYGAMPVAQMANVAFSCSQAGRPEGEFRVRSVFGTREPSASRWAGSGTCGSTTRIAPRSGTGGGWTSMSRYASSAPQRRCRTPCIEAMRTTARLSGTRGRQGGTASAAPRRKPRGEAAPRSRAAMSEFVFERDPRNEYASVDAAYKVFRRDRVKGSTGAYLGYVAHRRGYWFAGPAGFVRRTRAQAAADLAERARLRAGRTRRRPRRSRVR